mgnify:CR=1 FL=1
MRHYRTWAHVLGTLLLVTAGAMVLPLLVSVYYGEDDLEAFIVTITVTTAVGLPLWAGFRREQKLRASGAFLIAAFGWVVIGGVSAVPFVLHGSVPSFIDAFFEMISGYTTTGATILPDIEALPHGLLLWRSETHFLGGMGFITLAVLFLPHGIIGLRLFRAESSPGQIITKERFTARNRDAMWALWGIYVALNALQVLLLLPKMSLFDALCHAWGTVSTSGFSTYNSSMGHFESAWVDWVTIVFMFLGGVSFMLFISALRGDWRRIQRDTELWWYAAILAVLCGGVALVLWGHGTYGLLDSVRFGTFQVMSILTTTGFTTADYELWPNGAQMLLYIACFVGACAGSTTSGIKVVHYVILGKFMVGAVRKIFFQPLAVISVRLNKERIETSAVHLAICYFVVNIFLVLGGGVVMSLLDDMDVMSAMSSVIASLMNIGPGFGEVGPSQNWSGISDAGKVFLTWNMLVGRLEMFTALVLFYPSFWRS